jgi:uncharacterized protein (TIGR04255 family)
VYFDPPLFNFRAEHVGLFWSSIKDEFPVSSQNVPISSQYIPSSAGGPEIISPGEVFPLQRFWLTSKNGVSLIQIQKNAFIFNWRKVGDEYPHFEPLKELFDKYYESFRVFLDQHTQTGDIPIGACELAYVNVIGDGSYWNALPDTSTIIPSFSVPQSGIEGVDPSDVNLQTVYPISNDLVLTIGIQNRREPNSNRQFLYFELRAAGRLGHSSKRQADEWFDRAHDVIGRSFTGMTNPSIQAEHWQPVSDS